MKQMVIPVFVFLVIFSTGCDNKTNSGNQTLENAADQLGMSDNSEKNSKDYKSEAEIIIYGSPGCRYCNKLRHQLDSRNLKYAFQDIDSDPDKYSEMVNFVKKKNLDEGRQLVIPVGRIELGSQVYGFMGADINYVDRLLRIDKE